MALQQCMNMTAAISSAALAIFAADTAIFQCVNERVLYNLLQDQQTSAIQTYADRMCWSCWLVEEGQGGLVLYVVQY
jgi:hypothetical protein